MAPCRCPGHLSVKPQYPPANHVHVFPQRCVYVCGLLLSSVASTWPHLAPIGLLPSNRAPTVLLQYCYSTATFSSIIKRGGTQVQYFVIKEKGDQPIHRVLRFLDSWILGFLLFFVQSLRLLLVCVERLIDQSMDQSLNQSRSAMAVKCSSTSPTRSTRNCSSSLTIATSSSSGLKSDDSTVCRHMMAVCTV